MPSDDSTRRAAEQKRSRDYRRARYAADPEFRERVQAITRAWQERRRQDPERMARLRETQREWARVRRRAQGKKRRHSQAGAVIHADKPIQLP